MASVQYKTDVFLYKALTPRAVAIQYVHKEFPYFYFKFIFFKNKQTNQTILVFSL